jgi:hypothetical protein
MYDNHFIATWIAQALHIDFRVESGDSMLYDVPECDILMIDTWHTYDQLTKELVRLSPKSRRLIVMHDTSTPWAFKDEPRATPNSPVGTPISASQGLWPAVVDFLAAHPDWVLWKRDLRSYGLSILRKVNTLHAGQSAFKTEL